MADPKRRAALGKGIESLLGPRPAAAAMVESTGKPLEIALDRIERNPSQTRTRFDEAKLAELAQSIAATGVVQPVVVRELPGGRYQLIMGERRWRASQAAGKTTIPAIVRQVSDEQALEMTIVENLQRADLNPMEQARAFERLSREFKLTQEQMAARTGKDRASVGNFIRLLKLPDSIQGLVESGALSFGHARALLGLESRGADGGGGGEGDGAGDVGAADGELCAGVDESGGEAEGEEGRRPRPMAHGPECARGAGPAAAAAGAAGADRGQEGQGAGDHRVCGGGGLRCDPGRAWGELRARCIMQPK